MGIWLFHRRIERIAIGVHWPQTPRGRDPRPGPEPRRRMPGVLMPVTAGHRARGLHDDGPCIGGGLDRHSRPGVGVLGFVMVRSRLGSPRSDPGARRIPLLQETIMGEPGSPIRLLLRPQGFRSRYYGKESGLRESAT